VGHVVVKVQYGFPGFWWPKFTASIKKFLRECEACQGAIPGTIKAPAILTNLQEPTGHWQVIHMDFIFSFPMLPNTGNDGCFGSTCRFSNRTHLILCKEMLTSADFA
jgi:hypothetical protein